jgi:hypothetical protein
VPDHDDPRMTGSAGPEGRTAATPAARMGSGAGRLIRAWRVMRHEQRLAAYAAIGLFVAMFLPWYQRQFFVVVGGKLHPGSDSQTAWAQFSLVEAAVLLVAAGVLTLLFQRSEGKAFHLPGGDGWVITAAGLWTCALIVWRIFDKQGGSAHGQNATTYGIEWGIFVALGVAAFLAYAGSRIRASHRPEPPLPGDDGPRDAPPPKSEPPEVDATAPTIRRAAPPQATRPEPPARDDEPRRERGWLTAPRRAAAAPDRPDRSPTPPERQPQRPRRARWVDEPPPEWSGEEPRLWSNRPPQPKPAAGADEDVTIPLDPKDRRQN